MATPKDNRYVPPKPKVPNAASAKTPKDAFTRLPAAPMMPKMPQMMNKPAGPSPEVKAQRLAKEKDAIAARARAKGLNPSKADIEATYKRNRQRITASRRAAAKKGK